MPVGNFNLPITGDYWTPPSDWIDISSVGNNEINILVADMYGVAFTVTTASGTYSIDWGDGVVETGRVSGTKYYHLYTLGTGTPCSLGYTTFKIRIYGASGNITRFQTQKVTTGDGPTLGKNTYRSPLLWVVFGTNGLTNFSDTFSNGSDVFSPLIQSVYMPSVLTSITTFGNAFGGLTDLKEVKGLSSTWGSVTSVQNMFSACSTIETIVLPSSWPNTITIYQNMFQNCLCLRTVNLPSSWSTAATNFDSMFAGCINIDNIKLPSSWPTGTQSLGNMFSGCRNIRELVLPSSWGTSTTTTQNMFNLCVSMIKITLPTNGFRSTHTTTNGMFDQCNSLTEIDIGSTAGSTWGGVTDTQIMFRNCQSLKKLTLPQTLGSITNATSMFDQTYNLQVINNLRYVGTATAGAGCNFTTFFRAVAGSTYVTSATFDSYISRIAINGASGDVNYISAFRLTQAGSTFTGTSPHINCSFCNMGQADLVNLFNDLPTLVNKTCNITSNPGAALLTPAERAIATGKGWTIVG